LGFIGAAVVRGERELKQRHMLISSLYVLFFEGFADGKIF